MGVDTLIFVIIICFILSLTVISNILVLVVMLRVPKILNPTNVLICNLTISDIVLSGVVLPQNIHDVSHATVEYFEGDFSCRLVNFSPLLCIMASIYSMVAMSFERKRAIVILHEQQTTLSQTVRLIPIIWCLSLAFCVPTMRQVAGCISFPPIPSVMMKGDRGHSGGCAIHGFICMSLTTTGITPILYYVYQDYVKVRCHYEYSEYQEDLHNGSYITRCGSAGVSKTFSIVNGVVILLLAYALPLATLLANYGSILVFFRSRGLFDTSSRTESVTARALFKSRKNVVKMLILVAALFALSWLPYFVLLIIEKATGKNDVAESDSPVNMMRIALSVLSTAYNFLLNIVYNKNFRTGFWAMFTCQKVVMKQNIILPVDTVHSVVRYPTTVPPRSASVFTLTLPARSVTLA